MILEHRGRWLALVLVACLGVRLALLVMFGHLFSLAQGVVHGEGAYDVRALNLLETGALGLRPGEVDVNGSSVLYPYLLAAAYALGGRSVLTVSLLNILCDLVTAWAVVQIGWRLFPKRPAVGLLGGLCFVFYPYLIFQSFTVGYTALMAALLSVTVLAFIELRARPQMDRRALLLAAGCGVALGLLALTRPPATVIAFGAALWFLARLNVVQTFVRLLPVALVSALVVAPWLLHTYHAFNRFIPIAGNFGVGLWGGNSPYTVPFIQAGYPLLWMPEHLTLGPMPSALELVEDSERLADLSAEYLRANPDQIPSLLFWKFYAQWTPDIFPWRNPINGVIPYVREADGRIRALTDPAEIRANGFAAEGDVYADPLFNVLGRWAHRFYFGGLLALALIGGWATRREWRDVSLLWLVMLALTAFFVLTTPCTRYRAPTDPLLFLFSAAALVNLLERWRARVTAPQPAAASQAA